MVRNILAIFFLFCFATTQAQEKLGYQIKVKIDNFDQKELYLGYYYGDKQYLKDTAYLASNGWFYFEGEDPNPAVPNLPVVLKADNDDCDGDRACGCAQTNRTSSVAWLALFGALLGFRRRPDPA